MSNEQSTREELVQILDDDPLFGRIGYNHAESLADRFLDSPVIRRIQAEALREAAEGFESGTVEHDEIKYSSDAPLGWTDVSVVDAVMSSGPVMDWLRGRADRIERGETA